MPLLRLLETSIKTGDRLSIIVSIKINF